MHRHSDSCIDWMMLELHSVITVIVHRQLQPYVKAARICIDVHDLLFIVEDCIDVQIFLVFFAIWQPPHVDACGT